MDVTNPKKRGEVILSPFDLFKETFDREKDPEKKIAHAIFFMREVLSEKSGKRFQEFWSVKKLCGPLFQALIRPTKCHFLWKEYKELSIEAKRLRDIQDEQTAFATEQIHLAINALEADWNQYEKLLFQIPKIAFPKDVQSFLSQAARYATIQRELYFLKTLVDRLAALRNEVIATKMRMGPKAKLLKHLSKLGDEIFPKRKKLMEDLSAQFLGDVLAFLDKRFSNENDRTPYYVVRKEIHSFQKLAKQLSLTSRAFKEIRALLNRHWDILGKKDQERRKALEEQMKKEEKHLKDISDKLKDFDTFCFDFENLSIDKLGVETKKLLEEIQQLPLTHKTRRHLEGQVDKRRGLALDKRARKKEKKEEEAQKLLEELKDKLAHLAATAEERSLDQLLKEEKSVREALNSFVLNPSEAYYTLRQLTEVEGHLLDKQEGEALLQEGYQVAYDARFSLTEKIKKEMKDYRKGMGGSGLDFQRAMVYRELYDNAKIQLDRELEALNLLEEKFDSQKS